MRAERANRGGIARTILRQTLLVVLVPTLLLGAVAILALVTLARSATSSVDGSREVLANDVISSDLSSRADQLTREIGFFVAERIAALELLARQEAIIDVPDADSAENRQRAERALGEFILQFDDYSSVRLIDADGGVMATTAPAGFDATRAEPWWTDAWAKGVDVGEPALTSSGALTTTIAVRVTKLGQPTGVLVGELNLDLVERAADDLAGEAGREVLIVRSDGLLVSDTATGHDRSRILQIDSRVQTSDDLLAIQSLSFVTHERATGALILKETSGGFAFLGELMAASAGGANADLLSEELGAAFDWVVLVEQPTDTAFASLSQLETLRSNIIARRNVLGVVVLALLALAAASAIVTAGIMSKRVVAPILALRDAANHVADNELPLMVQEIAYLDPDAEVPDPVLIDIGAGDELGELSDSINELHATAVTLAGQQARLRHVSRESITNTFTNLGRRNQNLLTRQLALLDRLEATEADPVTLDSLFQLDHLATRMRRNAESLLVMAGVELPRRFTGSVTLREIVQAAAAAVEDYQRVEVMAMPDAAVDGSLAGGLAHLFTELIENACRYSRPQSPVRIYGTGSGGSVHISVIDEGIGMDSERLASINEQLASPPDISQSSPTSLGLIVVAQIAQLLDLDVEIVRSPIGTLAAQVIIDGSLLDYDRPVHEDSDDPMLAGEFAVAATRELATPVDASPVPHDDDAAHDRTAGIEQETERLARPSAATSPYSEPRPQRVDPPQSSGIPDHDGNHEAVFPQRRRGEALSTAVWPEDQQPEPNAAGRSAHAAHFANGNRPDDISIGEIVDLDDVIDLDQTDGEDLDELDELLGVNRSTAQDDDLSDGLPKRVRGKALGALGGTRPAKNIGPGPAPSARPATTRVDENPPTRTPQQVRAALSRYQAGVKNAIGEYRSKNGNDAHGEHETTRRSR